MSPKQTDLLQDQGERLKSERIRLDHRLPEGAGWFLFLPLRDLKGGIVSPRRRPIESHGTIPSVPRCSDFSALQLRECSASFPSQAPVTCGAALSTIGMLDSNDIFLPSFGTEDEIRRDRKVKEPIVEREHLESEVGSSARWSCPPRVCHRFRFAKPRTPQAESCVRHSDHLFFSVTYLRGGSVR